MLGVIYAECHYARLMLIVLMLRIVTQSVVKLSVVAPSLTARMIHKHVARCVHFSISHHRQSFEMQFKRERKKGFCLFATDEEMNFF
jgi:hypothetical protein